MDSIKMHLAVLANLPGGPLGFTMHFIQTQYTRLPVPATDYSGKTVIVTGANIGLGLEAARHFARLGASKVILGCRNAEKGEAAKQDIETTTGARGVVEVWPLDLGSFDSVRDFCARAARLDRLDAVVENAGVATGELEFMEGFESTITTNVVSTFLLALLVLPVLRKTAARFNTTPRLVIVSSDAHALASFHERSEPDIFGTYKLGTATYVPPDRYNSSKLMEVFVVRELVRQMQSSGPTSVIINAVNPGLCRSAFFRHAPLPLYLVMILGLFILGRSSEVGSRTLLAGAAGGLETHGKYIDSCQVRDPSPFVLSEEGAETQKRVYSQLLAVLEEIEPGITKNI